MRESKTCPELEWQQMPTKELDKILQGELEKDYPDQEVVLPILQILEDREKDMPVEKTPEVLAILKSLRKHQTTTQSKNRRPWLAGIAALAATACIVVMALPRTVGADSFFDVLFRWTSSIFEFVDPDNDESYPSVGTEFITDNPGLQRLYDKVMELGVTESVVPAWLPDGFVLTDLKAIQMSDGVKVYGEFEKGNTAILIAYRISDHIKPKVEKKDAAVEAFEYAEVSHFIMDNKGNLSVTWSVDGAECSVATDIQKDDIYKVIKSIYRSELLS